MRRFQIVVNWVQWGGTYDPDNTDRRLIFLNAKDEADATAIFIKDNTDRHHICKVLNRGPAK